MVCFNVFFKPSEPAIIPFDSGNLTSVIIAAVLPSILVIILLISLTALLIVYCKLKVRTLTVVLFIVHHAAIFLTQKRRHEVYTLSTVFIPPMYYVEKDCNMVKFAKQNIQHYEPDCGKGYFQLTVRSQEYISSTTEVVLISEVTLLR